MDYYTKDFATFFIAGMWHSKTWPIFLYISLQVLLVVDLSVLVRQESGR